MSRSEGRTQACAARRSSVSLRMMSSRWALWLSACLVGCGHAPVPVAPAAPAPVAPAALATLDPVPQASLKAADFEQRQENLAGAAESQGRWADAALAWEVLTLLRPDLLRYAEAVARVRERISTAVSDRMSRGQAAMRRGELDVAAQTYLEALSFAPDHTGAADALRAVERERNRRSFVGKFTRNTLTRRAVADGEMRYSDLAREGKNGNEGGHLEHATLLLRQGEFDGAIGVLRDAMRGGLGAPATKAMLVEAYLQKAEKLLPRDPRGARSAAESALQIEPRNATALALVQRTQLPGARGPGVAPAASPPASGAARR